VEGERQEAGRTVSTNSSQGISLADLSALYLLSSVKGFGPQKFKQLHENKLKPTQILQDPSILHFRGKRGDTFREAISQLAATTAAGDCESRAERQLEAARKYGGQIMTYDHLAYPPNLYASNYPLPILYVRGGEETLKHRPVVACVGSRKVRPPYSELQSHFARVACRTGWGVVSGFALGADTLGHRAALEEGGITICVMPGGLDRPFPPENKALWEQLLDYPKAVFVSEYAFGTRAAALTLRKRNKLIVAFSCGVVIAQSSASGGAMNAYRFALEDKKPVATFKADASSDLSGNELIESMLDSQLVADQSRVFALASSAEEYQSWLRTLSCSM
jgi:DNA protecting protein DprA